MASKYRKLNSEVRQEIMNTAVAMHDLRVQKARDARPWMTSGYYNDNASKAARELGDAVYKELYPAAVRARISKLPEGWLPEVNTMRVHIKSARNAGHDSVLIHFTEKRRILHAHHDERNLPTIAGPKASILAEDRKLTEQWGAERNELQSKTWQLLQQLRTVEALFERWPEVLKIMPEGYFAPLPPSTALVIQSSELNAILGLR